MRVFVCSVLIGLGVLIPADAQNPAQEVIDRHGGAAVLSITSRFEIRGRLTTEQGTGAFTLKVSSGKTRLETADRVLVKQGAAGQWWFPGQSTRSAITTVLHGSQEIYLTPFGLIGELVEFSYDGLIDQFHRFESEAAAEETVGYQPPAPLMELYTHPESNLLVFARFSRRGEAQTPIIISFFDYEMVEGRAVPRQVTRSLGDRIQWEIQIDTIDFEPSFSESEFDFVSRGER